MSIYYKLNLFKAHTMILIFRIFMNVNKLGLNQEESKKIRAAKDLVLTSTTSAIPAHDY